MRGQRELELAKDGRSVVGIDEVGRGCIAGPIYAACVSLSYADLGSLPKAQKDKIRDSKTLSAKQRAEIKSLIMSVAEEAYIAQASVTEIEDLGINEANFLAMRRALSMCQNPYDVVLVDGRQKIRGYYGTQETIIGGDTHSYAIAAASILAKLARDRYMTEQAEIYPDYGFEKHMGYGTQFHRDQVNELGICPLHRRNFAPIKELYEKGHTNTTPGASSRDLSR